MTTRSRAAALWLAAALSALPAAAQNLKPDTQGRLEFASFTPRTMFDLARERRQNWNDQKIWGDLGLPKGSAAKVPAMVLMHGSGGIEPGMAQWVEAFNEIGIATFVVSSFEPRGVKRTAEDQSLVPYSANLADAFQALQFLAGHPRIDASRIGVMGFSRGGSVAWQTAVEPLRRALVKSELKFALHIAAYAGCNQVYWSPQITRAPMLNLVGEADDYTTAEPCEELARRYAQAGASVRTVKYPFAHHSWDGLYPLFFLPNATSGAPCGILRWDIEPWRITSERSGRTVDPAKLDEFFAGCVKRGVHAGRNEAAFRQSRRDAQEFARTIFSPAPRRGEAGARLAPMRTTVFGALLLLGLGVLLKSEDIADTPAFSATAVSATARVSVTPQAELTPRAELAPNAEPTPNAGTASTVAVVSRPPPALPSTHASAAKPAVDAARSPATPRIAAIDPAPRTGQVIPGRHANAKAIASAIESPAFQDTVSPLVRLYLAYFERFPDYEGLDYYIHEREGGGPLAAISDEFATSREIELRYGSLDNAAFVDRVFRNVFDGAGDAQQRASWVAQLDSGAMTRGQVMLAFSESAAFRTATANEVFVSTAYAEILGRSPDTAEFSRWVRLLDAGGSGEAVIQGLLAKR